MLYYDVVIIGAGIAGLWTANRLQQQGLSVLVLEQFAIGAGQTIHSQGIIHGGIKYSLTGKLSPATRNIAPMPTIWQDCFAGKGDIDLSTGRILSDHYLLWSASSLRSKIRAIIANKMLRGQALPRNNFPKILQQAGFSGQVYQVAEQVVDVKSVLRALTQALQPRIIKVSSWKVMWDARAITALHIQNDTGETAIIKAQQYIFTAGQGNQTLCEATGIAQMQTRPLHMVYAKLDQDLPFYAHCVDLQQVPRLTITTHYSSQGNCIWYLGGNLAETGVNRLPSEQCQFAKQELQQLFPKHNFESWQFSSFMLQRAEPLQPLNQRPPTFSVSVHDNIMIAWPTKLVLAPALAQEIISQCAHLVPCHSLHTLAWAAPKIAEPHWEYA